MSTPIPESQLAGIKQALVKGHKIEAIKLYREATNCGLAEAKTEVEKLEAQLPASASEKSGVSSSGKGCLAVLAIICFAALLVALWVTRAAFF